MKTQIINSVVRNTFVLLKQEELPHSTECALWIAKHWIDDHQEQLENFELSEFYIDEEDVHDYWLSYIRQEVFPKDGAIPSEFKVKNIEWDTDGETVDLPKEVLIPLYVNEEDADEYISDLTGFCHFGFDIEYVDEKYLAIAYYKDGLILGVAEYSSKEDAIEFAKQRNWDKVINSKTEAVEWRRN